METTLTPGIRTTKDARLVLVLGILSVLLMGPVTGVPGLILARTIQPMEGAARVGRAMCWYGCFVSYTVALLFYRSGIAAEGLELVMVLASNLALLFVCLKWLRPPAGSRVRAVSVAIVGMLVAAPVITPGFMQLALPMHLMVFGYLRGRLDGWTFVAVALLPFLSFFPALLAIYWPNKKVERHPFEAPQHDQRRWRVIFQLVVSYLVASIVVSWVWTLDGWVWAKVFPAWPGLNFFWVTLLPVLAPVITLASIINDASSESRSHNIFLLAGLVAGFIMPFFMTWMAIRYREGFR